MNTPTSFHGHVQREDALTVDLPTIPLIWIRQSTNNFSELDKLGEGGFGPVYKVPLNFWICMLAMYNFALTFSCHSYYLSFSFRVI